MKGDDVTNPFRRSFVSAIALLAIALALPSTFYAQSERVPDGAEVVRGASGEAEELEDELVSINWLEEMGKGGATMLALGVLSLAALAIAIERSINMRRKQIAPAKLVEHIRMSEGEIDSVRLRKLCQTHASTLARTIDFIHRHRPQPYDMVMAAASDSASREIRSHMGRVQLLAAAAGIAPLLGLLGTMIGMIESFKLVSIYGDEGGSAILADSIAKALITTAVGLITAIPSLAVYHYFKHRLSQMTVALEMGIETVVAALYFGGGTIPEQENRS